MAIFVYLLLCLIWGSSWIAIKLGLADSPPLWTAALRFVLAILILWGIVLIRRLPLPISLRALLRLAHPGLYMYGFHTALIYFAEKNISSGLTSVLFASFPLFVALLSLIMLRAERLPRPAWLGLVIGIGGIVLISYDSLRLSEHLFLGTALALAATFAAAFGMVLHKRHHSRENVVVAAAVQMTLGGLPLLLAAFLFEPTAALRFTTATIGSILYLAIFATVVAFLSYYWLLARLRAVTLALMAFITPIVALIIGLAFFHEHITLTSAVGAGLILGSVLLVITPKSPRSAAPTP